MPHVTLAPRKPYGKQDNPPPPSLAHSAILSVAKALAGGSASVLSTPPTAVSGLQDAMGNYVDHKMSVLKNSNVTESARGACGKRLRFAM